MRTTPRIGLLPLYLELYDQAMPDRRAGFTDFMQGVEDAFAANGVEVVRAPVCRREQEFKDAVDEFEGGDVDCVVTLHLAYSPSLESVDALCATDLPIIILDATMDAAFGPDVDPDRIMYNHGVHGVMDMASMLRRRGKPFHIIAGHVENPDVIARAVDMAGAAFAARSFHRTRALRVGEAFKGMGDFSVAEGIMLDVLGIRVEQVGLAELAPAVASVTDEEIEAEIARDVERFASACPRDVHARSARVGLGLRRLLAEGDYSAFSMNFLAFDSADGPVDTVPFLEASKAMARGVGYAGEGDVLTASLVGALARGFGRTTFTEIFCPDWEGNSLFLSHMGEVNPDVAAAKPALIEKPFPFTPAHNPAVVTCAPENGDAVFVNLVPGPDDSFGLIVAPVVVLGDTQCEELRNSVRGWIRPMMPVPQFLETYSRHGGTHHSALTLGHKAEGIAAFARMAGLECVVIE